MRLARVILPFIMLILLTSMDRAQDNKDEISIIPKPVEMSRQTGDFIIGPNTSISYARKGTDLTWCANYLATKLGTAAGLGIKVAPEQSRQGSIVLAVDSTRKGLKKEGYELVVTPDRVFITGHDKAGAFYGVETLLQLLPPNIESKDVVRKGKWSIRCVRILDYPRFPWRGMHLDVGRHFFPVSFIKEYLDLMAMYKFNVFHWHLTEDQGWRIEIKKYPRLTEVGAWRKETMGDGKPYGGFYTQDEIRDIVKYAGERHIEVVPEIEMPGHAMATLAAYPQFSCRRVPLDVATTWGVLKDVFCAGNDSTFVFLEDILTEVFDLFPCKYIHIGGDECPKDRWKECPLCQARMKREGLKTEEELQSYFIRRIEEFVNSRGRKVIGWDEILEGGLAPNATVMSWRGTQGGVDAARSGHDVIMTPTSNCYFDYSQALTGEVDSTHAILPIDSVYAYEPVPAQLSKEQASHVLGAQGNVWTEWMEDSKRVEYMVLPRMCALSEVVWTPKDQRNYEDFQNHLVSQYERFDCMGVNYRIPTPFILGGAITSFEDTTIAFRGIPASAKAYYTLDGTDPTRDALLYTKPIPLSTSTLLKAKVFLPSGKTSNTVWIDFNRLDPTKNGLFYVVRHPGLDSSMDPENWVHGRSGVTWTVELPEIPDRRPPFLVRFTGFLTVEREGLYTFYMKADSGSSVTLENSAVINDSSPLVGGWRKGQILLREGKHQLSVVDVEINARNGFALEYEGPGIPRKKIPSYLLTTD